MTSAHFEPWIRNASVPRVQIEYETPQGDRVELPFVMGVLSALSGDAEVPRISERRFHDVDTLNFDAHLRALGPRLALKVKNVLDEDASELSIELSFGCLDDFSPDALMRSSAPLRRLLESRKQLAELASQGDAVATQPMIGELDRRLRDQVNLILQHPVMKQLEASWRGLHFLVSNTPHDAQDASLKIRVFNVTKRELHRSLKQHKGALWRQSPWFERIHEDEYGTFGGHPFGCLIADFEFDHSVPDVELLSELSKTCAAAHVPLIGAASPALFLVDSWPELFTKRDMHAIFTTPQHVAFRALRAAEESRYLALTLPRFLVRLPYGARTDPVDEFAFEEDTAGGDSAHFCWANAAYAFGVVINRAFAEYGWCSRIRGAQSGGLVPPIAAYGVEPDEPAADMRCPLEVSLPPAKEAELSQSGFVPLLAFRRSPVTVFHGASSLHAPERYDDTGATENARLAAQLPYMFAVCRFAHYLKVIVRDRLVGSYQSREHAEAFLQEWISQYVHGSPERASEAEKAELPLAAARVELIEAEDDPTYLHARFSLQPHYQLEGLTAVLRLHDRIRAPSERAGESGGA